jgi:hypothetical protein
MAQLVPSARRRPDAAPRALHPIECPVPESPSDDARPPSPPARRSRWRTLALWAIPIAAALVALRLALPYAVRWYVNRALDRSISYRGIIGDVDIHLWRGAYSIEHVRVLKTAGSVPVPLFAAERVDLAIEWPALMHGSLVGRIAMQKPELNFVDGADGSDDQTGAGGPWLQIIRSLFPFRIDRAELVDGTIHFRAFRTKPPVDVFLSEVRASITNLTNIHDDVTPMFARVEAKAKAMGTAKVDCEIELDPSSYRPTFQLALRLLGLDVTKTNPLAQAYGDFDFERGWFDLVIELDVKQGAVEGYVKPLFRNLVVFSPRRDVADGNVLKLFWQALVGLAAAVFENQSRDQVGTVIPVRGDLARPATDVLATIANVLRNAFVRAYLPRLHGKASEIDGLTFGPGSLPELGATK